MKELFGMNRDDIVAWAKEHRFWVSIAAGLVLVVMGIVAGWIFTARTLTAPDKSHIAVNRPFRPFIDRLKGVPYSRKAYHGIDVSKYQGTIRWGEVAKDRNIEFVYIRATHGTDLVDPYYAWNNQEARRHGLKVGAYHFFTWWASVDAQFRLFLATAEPSRQDLIPMLDVEPASLRGSGWTTGQLQDSIAKFARLIEKHYHCRPMIYSNQNFYNANLAPTFNHYILYLANYRRQPVLHGSNHHNLWQYSEQGHIRGIGERVDLCRFTHGTTLADITMPREKH